MSSVLNSLFYISHYFRVYTGISNISNIFVWISMSPITPCVSESISLSSSISFLVILYPLSSSWSSFILLRACCLPGLFEGSKGARGLKLEERRSALLPPSAAAAGHQSRMWPNADTSPPTAPPTSFRPVAVVLVLLGACSGAFLSVCHINITLSHHYIWWVGVDIFGCKPLGVW